MDTKHYLNLLDELDDLEQTDTVWNKTKRKEKFTARNPKKLDGLTNDFIRRQDDSSRNFKFTYRAARFEEGWLLESLGAFYEHRWISDVLRRVKGGKEASVYLCRSGDQVSSEYQLGPFTSVLGRLSPKRHACTDRSELPTAPQV